MAAGCCTGSGGLDKPTLMLFAHSYSKVAHSVVGHVIVVTRSLDDHVIVVTWSLDDRVILVTWILKSWCIIHVNYS